MISWCRLEWSSPRETYGSFLFNWGVDPVSGGIKVAGFELRVASSDTAGSFIPIFRFKPLRIRALKFIQDHRIKKIFLPVPLKAGKKGKKHNPSSREGIQSLCLQHSKTREKAYVIGLSAIFSLERNCVFLGFISTSRRLEAVKKIKSIQLILSENMLASLLFLTWLWRLGFSGPKYIIDPWYWSSTLSVLL